MAVSVLVVVCLLDLGLAIRAHGDMARRTPLLSLPPFVEVLVLVATSLWALAAAMRSRLALIRAETARLAADEEAKRLLQVIDNSPAVIYMRDREGRYLLVNRRYEELFGIRREEIVGRTDFDMFPPEAAADFRANDLKALASGAAVQAEESVPQVDGAHTYITLKYPLTDIAGRHYAICGISTDITDLKRAEEEANRLNSGLESLNAGLESRVRERTAELEASTRELDAFAYSVSHDLRAPLRAVAGFSELILEDYGSALDATGRDYLSRVVAATTRMSRLIDDLLTLSRATRAELSWRPVDLSAMAQRILADLRSAEGDPERPVELIVEDGLHATGDPALLELVLQNLISNAWKFTAKQDKALIHVGVERLADGGCAFFVRDTGAGFDMRYADKLFVPFQRLHSVDDFAGTGIGLAIVGRIINRHGGRIWAEGHPERGAVFRFVLPEHRPALREGGAR
ncbi:PAS domain-containing protein [Actinospica sp. MGRD01-02]|uniref:Sensor-like histidine kinase SenX3 n=1 Tax=Actinospica acidithermotolerans TaxID=2828514 RepID=A0A941ELC3_9ACTN|nr:ATP-binding protein [Actinospica acidithermotolerans]MBR7831189.1 PAS domain-containing protein [Actinospica acidithermotolerans]